MSYRKRAGGGKRDTAEGPIVDALRAVGARVWHIGGTGNPDLLVEWRGVWTPLEAKSKGGTLTRNQQALAWVVVRTPEEALREIGAMR